MLLLPLGLLLFSFLPLDAQNCFRIYESFKQCSSRCEPSCQNRMPACTKSCGPPKCQCDKGYFRDDRSGECFNKNQCDTIMKDAPTCDTLLCPPMHQCMPSDKDGAYCMKLHVDPGRPSFSCDNLACTNGETCTMDKGYPQCIKSPVKKPTCDTLLCPPMHQCMPSEKDGAYCMKLHVDPGRPSFNCDNLACTNGQMCTMEKGYPDCIDSEVRVVAGKFCKTHSDCPYGNSCVTNGNGDLMCQNVHVDPIAPQFTCENLSCRGGQKCTMDKGYPDCVEDVKDPAPVCTRPCARGFKCVGDFYNAAYCKKDDGCGANEEMKQCSNACFEKACGEENISKQCNLGCNPPKCQCSTGFVRESTRGVCIKPDKCPNTPIMIVDPPPPRPCRSTPECNSSLTCINGECVSVDPGPSGPFCPRPCPRGQKCVSDAFTEPMCKVDDGCGPNEEMKQCSNACNEINCGEENLEKMCNFACNPPKCQCMKGFFRERYSETCVRKDQCPPPLPTTTLPTPSTTDNTIPCGPLRCHPAWSCSCTKPPCPDGFYFCMAPHTMPTPTCGDVTCSTSETCETIKVSCTRPPCPSDRKVCVLKPGATAPPTNNCGDMNCAPYETCEVARVSCTRPPCPKDSYYCMPKEETTGAPVPNCGDLYCGPSESCERARVSCSRPPCPKDSYFCMTKEEVTTAPTPNCGDLYCSPFESCEVARVACSRPPCPKDSYFCMPKEEQTTTWMPVPPRPSLCGPSGLVCAPGEECITTTASCSRYPCPPPLYECKSGSSNEGPSLPTSCATVHCPRGKRCRMQNVRCVRAPCPQVPQCY